MRCLLIGDDQFLDCIVAKELLLSGSEVALLGKEAPPEEIADDTIHIVGDVESLAENKDEIEAFKPDTVIHLSARTHNHAKTFCEMFEGSISHCVMASSANVYKANALVYKTEMGDLNNNPITEKGLLREEPLGKDSNHDRLAVERRLTKSSFITTFLRLPPVYGPGDRLYRLLPLMSRMLDKRPFIVVAETQADWRWTHAYSVDVAHGLALAALKPSESNRIFNIGEKKAPTILERISHLATIIGWDGDVVALPESKLPAHVIPAGNFDQNLELDSSKIRSEIGYKEETDYYDGLYESIEWYRENLPSKYKGVKFNYKSEDALKELVQRVVSAR